MIKNRFLAAAMAVLAGFAVLSCEELEQEVEKIVEVSISPAGSEFDANGEATLNLTLSPISIKDVTVTLGISSQAESGYTSIDAASLDFEGSVTIPAGTQTVPVKVSVKTEDVQPGQEAVIVVASASGATVGKDATAYIKVPVGGYGPQIPEMSGARVWAIIGAFNDWAGDVELTKTDAAVEQWTIDGLSLGGEFKFRGNKEWGDYVLGAAAGAQIVSGEDLPLVYRGQNITIEEGVYDIVLYPTEFKAVFTKVEVTGGGGLNWTLKYNGSEWVEGYLSYGQNESFEVSGTDKTKYYIPNIINVDEYDILAELEADPDAFFAELQAEIDDELDLYAQYFGYSREDLVPLMFYNEDNDGATIYLNGQPAGNYQFIVMSLDGSGNLDKGYAYINFTKTEDFLEYYPWHENYTKRDDWSAVWDGWSVGDEGDYYWVAGNAPGAAYVSVDSYNDEELEYYFDGNVANLLNYTGSDIADYLYLDYSLEDLVDYGALIPVEADGTFSCEVSTWDLIGETNVYIVAFDASGKVIDQYGVSVVDVPEYQPEPIDWVERTDWAANYDATVDTGDTDYPDAIVVTACDAEYYTVSLYGSGALDAYGIDEVGRSVTSDIVTYLGYGYSMEDLMEYDIVHNSVPVVEAWGGLYNGVEIFIFGLNADGTPTGEWHMELLDGYEETPVELPEMTLVDNWSVTPVGTAAGGKVAITVDAPGIQWYYIEENSDEDLDYYYDGDIAYLAAYMEQTLAGYLSSYTVDELLYSGSDPQTTMTVYNSNVPTSIYILEFDENGKATGRYGKSDVTITAAAAPAKVKSAARKPAFRIQKEIVPETRTVTLANKRPAVKRAEGKFESAKASKAAQATKTAKVQKFSLRTK